jgi:hypothetical protein
MKKVTAKIFMLFVCVGLISSSCSKKDDDNVSPASDNKETVVIDDTRTQNESNFTFSEAEAAISDNSSTQRTSSSVIAGATIDATYASSEKRLIIIYDNSTEVEGRIRSGSIEVQLTSGTSWSGSDAILRITYNNYKATRVSDNKSITLKGSVSVKNVSGGLIATMTLADTRIRTIRSANMTITFDDGSKRTWNAAKKITIEKPTLSSYTVTVIGDTTIVDHGDNNDHVAVWGTTRLGTSFYTIIDDTHPIVWNSQACTKAPVSGHLSIEGTAKKLYLTYGVDSDGNPVSSLTCPYGVKLNWFNDQNEEKTKIIVY